MSVPIRYIEVCVVRIAGMIYITFNLFTSPYKGCKLLCVFYIYFI